MTPACTFSSRRRLQRGISLVVVMMILVVVTILGLGATQITMMSERGARNDRDMQLALQSAEAGLMDAAYEIDGPPAAVKRSGSFSADGNMDFRDGCGTGASKGLCNPTAAGKPAWQLVDFADKTRTVEFGEFTGRTFASAPAGHESGVMPAMNPRYVIEALRDAEVLGDGSKPTGYIYRVTAMGYGPRENIQAVLQMLYRKRKD